LALAEPAAEEGAGSGPGLRARLPSGECRHRRLPLSPYPPSLPNIPHASHAHSSLFHFSVSLFLLRIAPAVVREVSATRWSRPPSSLSHLRTHTLSSTFFISILHPIYYNTPFSSCSRASLTRLWRRCTRTGRCPPGAPPRAPTT
jgi:hypothetical protein